MKFDNILYVYNEEYLLSILNSKKDKEMTNLLKKFQKISKKKIPNNKMPKIKERDLNPLVNNKRFDTVFTETFFRKLN